MTVRRAAAPHPLIQWKYWNNGTTPSLLVGVEGCYPLLTWLIPCTNKELPTGGWGGLYGKMNTGLSPTVHNVLVQLITKLNH